MPGQSDGLAPAVELRVHGVSGTPAEQMLKCPTELLDQVAGDKSAGFFQCRVCDCEDNDANARAPKKEAYSWGGLTSGSASRALWLLFLPFILINLAHWMLPPSQTGPKAAGVAVRFLRLIALSLTLTLMLAAVEVAVDIVGWQCMATARCSDHLGPLSGLQYAPEGERLGITALPVALMVGFLLLLGRANPANVAAAIPRKNEVDDPAAGLDAAALPQPASTQQHGSAHHPPDPAVKMGDVPLAHENFWSPDESVRRLRACHVMTWASALAAVVLGAACLYVDGWTALRWLCAALLTIAVLILAAAFVAVWSTPITGRGGPSADQWTPRLKRLRNLSIVLLVVALVTVWFTRGDHGDMWMPTHLPGLRYTIYGLLIAQTVLLAVLFVATKRCLDGWRGTVWGTLRGMLWPLPLLFPRRAQPQNTEDGWAPTLSGFTAPLVATIAVLAGGGFSAGVGLWTAQYLGNPVPTTKVARCLEAFRAQELNPDDKVDGLVRKCIQEKVVQPPKLPVGIEGQVASINADAPLIVPPAYFVAALVFFALLIVFAVAGLLIWFVIIPKWTKEATTRVRTDAPGPPPPEETRVTAVARTSAAAALTDCAPAILARLAGVAVLAMLCLIGPFTYIYVTRGFDRVPITVPVLSNISVMSISATAAGLVAIAAAAFRNRQQRRVVGILWDVITFWPRANHPLTPPCYAERTVPDLKHELCWLTKRSDSTVVLSAHSQGTVIAAATVLQIKDPQLLTHVALLTFGCPLRRLYGRNFPAYFGHNSIDHLADAVDKRWINLWAHTDPIGGWVLSSQGSPVEPALPVSDPPEFTFDLAVVDHRLLDAKSLNARVRGGYEPICGHSGFWTRAEYDGAVEALVRALPTADS